MTSQKSQLREAKLALEDGTVFTGTALGASGTSTGEVVFNTSITGYQEILTDPSYRDQIVTMTYPLIGNYGICDEDVESRRVQVSGFVVKEMAWLYSNFRASKGLDAYLRENNVVGIAGIDTRALTRKLRISGAMKGIISTEKVDDAKLIDQAQQSPGLVGRDLVKDVTCAGTSGWRKGYESVFAGPISQIERKAAATSTVRPLVAAFDCGMKSNIARNLVMAGFEVVVVPAGASAAEIMERKPEGIFVSNGPGDPEPIDYTIKTIRELLKKEIPMFGICLGIELIGQALGGGIFKLKFGHRGANQPVKNLDTGRVEITSQNHGFAVDINSLPKGDVRITHINLNDQTLEGIAHKRLPMFAVQYHPEASPGPHDATYLFDAFYKMVQTGKTPECLGESD
ncbi:MAG: glutamine-hydrolyzing carbamoyl-phosphate synthase small subunit [Sedimentisphaerales bacterium]|nr:glutamine-hydrolyzing carbamoyl-phosphate synthase small subunit [Sedimentisphaerales bacterium]